MHKIIIKTNFLSKLEVILNLRRSLNFSEHRENNLHFVYQYDLIREPRTLDNCFEISLIQIDIQLVSCRVIELNRTYLFLVNTNDTYIVNAGSVVNQQAPKPLQKK